MTVVPLGAALAENTARAFQHTFNGPPWNDDWTDVTALAYLQQFLATPGYLGFAAVDPKGETQGACFGVTRYYGSTQTFYLHELFVTPEASGQRLATALLDTLEAELKTQGIGNIFLTTDRDAPAYKLYEKRGYFALPGGVLMLLSLKA